MDSVRQNREFYDSLDTGKRSSCRDIADSPRALRHIKRVAERIHSRHFASMGRDVRWLDVGCGRGATYSIASQLGYDYRGIDCSARNIEFCMAKYPQGRFECSDLGSYSGEFDLITFISSLHHFEDWRGAVAKAFSLLGAGGVLYVEHEPTRLFAALFRVWLRWGRRVDAETVGGVEIHWYREPSILSTELPSGRTEFHCDFIPVISYLGAHTVNPKLGRLLCSYRKIMPKAV